MGKLNQDKEWSKKSKPTDSDPPKVKKRGEFRQKQNYLTAIVPAFKIITRLKLGTIPLLYKNST